MIQNVLLTEKTSSRCVTSHPPALVFIVKMV